jgi:hypothetical protein
MPDEVEGIFAANSTDALSDLLAAYCEEHALPLTDAEELLHELWAMINEEKDPVLVAQYVEHTNWLMVFIAQWEAVQEREDNEAECKRNGHRDTGRGACATCGAFI